MSELDRRSGGEMGEGADLTRELQNILRLNEATEDVGVEALPDDEAKMFAGNFFETVQASLSDGVLPAESEEWRSADMPVMFFEVDRYGVGGLFDENHLATAEHVRMNLYRDEPNGPIVTIETAMIRNDGSAERLTVHAGLRPIYDELVSGADAQTGWRAESFTGEVAARALDALAVLSTAYADAGDDLEWE